MIELRGNDIWRASEKIGYLRGNDVYDHNNQKVGYYQENHIFDRNNRKLAYIEGDYLISESTGQRMRLEDNRRDISGGTISDITRCAIRILLGD